MRYFKVTSLPKFRLKRRKFSTLKIRIKWVRIEESGQNLGYDMQVWKSWREGTTTNIIDSSLFDDSSRNEIMRCIHIGLLCVQDNVARRRTMATIVLLISSNSLTLPIPSEPAFFMDSRTVSLPEMRLCEENSGTTRSSQSTTKSAPVSVNEASFTDPYPR
ncbi:putative non-specific serine/threonine protein kinase [Medicago truncatula]|uniref:Cysteine-rich RLK (Receptor-like kinase) protein, putative n=1 Tax=Medicago truncatula TaxID=3880 RepID=G7KDA8_MEDTR|nr:cysteine-rich RLK (receptor-like kinase) protein, putative [Medicago truncatula]RHN56352.1 putative non-specific serine/threonine protein kinase [Medicago truncatula]